MADNSIFIDKVKIVIKSGDGGDGMNSFKAYKGKPACGPDARSSSRSAVRTAATAARAAIFIYLPTVL